LVAANVEREFQAMQKDPEIDKKVPRNRTNPLQTPPQVNISIDLVISVYFYSQSKYVI
jgi:hypothetical protein